MKFMQTTIRLATVKATGKRYVVQQISFRGPTPVVHCWGECVWYKGGSRKHSGVLSFPQTDVTIAEVAGGVELSKQLFEQAVQARRDAGHVVTGRGRRVTDHGTPEQVARKREEAAQAHAFISAISNGDTQGAISALDQIANAWSREAKRERA